MSTDLEQIESSQRQHFEVLEHHERLSYAVTKNDYALFSLLKPTVSIDGNSFCVLYGPDLQSGVAGIGETLFAAIVDFNAAFHKIAPQKIEVKTGTSPNTQSAAIAKIAAEMEHRIDEVAGVASLEAPLLIKWARQLRAL